MRKILDYIHINPLIFLLFFFAYFIGKIYELFILFAVITIHETAHVLMAKYYNLKIEKVKITPIGINAKINWLNQQRANEAVIYSAGPLINLIMGIIACIMNSYFLDNSKIMNFFILVNFSFLFLNLLPILPLDGGKIFKKFLLLKIGYRKTIKIFSRISMFLSVFFVCLGIYQLINCWYNLSLLFIGIFIYICMYKEKEEMEYSFIKELIYKKENLLNKEVYNVKFLVCFENKKIMDVIKDFKSDKYHIVKVFDKDMYEVGEFTETQIFEALICFNANITLKNLLKG